MFLDSYTCLYRLLRLTGFGGVDDTRGLVGAIANHVRVLDTSTAAVARTKAGRSSSRAAPRSTAFAAADRAADDTVAVDPFGDAITAR